MKANELMVDDWVYMSENDIPRRITDIGRFDLISSYGISCYVDNIHPIPITPEILEKNGFVQNPRSKSRRSYQICNSDVYISWWRGRLNILFKPFIGHSTNHVNVDGKYVHDLQHALRICGIKKEIVL